MQSAASTFVGLALLCCAVMVGSGCKTSGEQNSSSRDVVEHPIEARIPQHDRAVPITKEQPRSHLPDPPRKLKTLSLFLDDPTRIDTTRLDVLLEGSSSVDVASVSSHRFVLLVGHPENRLYEHDLRTGTTTQIAKYGSGPGQLKFAEAVAHSDTAVYVARQDRRIDRFDCTTVPCTYEESTRLCFSPMAVTAVAPFLAVTGRPMLNRKGMKMEDWSGAIQMLGTDGMIEQTFGQMYQTEHHLVLSNYVRNSSLIYCGTVGQFVLASPKLPLIWAYDSDGTLEFVRTIEDFEPLALEYDSSERSIHKGYEEGYSTLHLQGPIASHFVIATVRHKTLPSGDSDLTGNDNDYYALDLKTDETYYLGRDAPRNEIIDRLFLVTDEHQVLVENGRVTVASGPPFSEQK